jgi:hypothetical protein
VVAVAGERVHGRGRAAGQHRADRGRAGEERAGLGRGHPHDRLHADLDLGLERHVVGLPGDHLGHGIGQAMGRGRARLALLLEQHLVGQLGEGVAHEDRLGHAEERPDRGPVPALAVAVHDVVVEQGVVVHQLERDPAGHTDRGRRAHCLGRQDRERGADALAAAVGLPTLGVDPAEVVLRHPAQTRVEAGEGIGQRRVDELLGPGEDGGRGVDHAATSWRRRAWRWSSTAARAAATPLRTAPSIVAGQPVSVHAPAR